MGSFRRMAYLLMSTSLLISACTGNLTGPSVRLDEAFVLEPGERAILAGRSARIRFVGVTGNSRCPIDVVCVQGGDAIVEIAVRSGRNAETSYDLHTGDLQPVRHGTLTITLVQLAPDPFSTQTIPPQDYRATLRVTE
jgi:hypothetical protein